MDGRQTKQKPGCFPPTCNLGVMMALIL